MQFEMPELKTDEAAYRKCANDPGPRQTVRLKVVGKTELFAL